MCNHYCRLQKIPFTCTECPIRQVQMSCWLNTDFGDWKFWDRRNKKWPVINKQKQQDRGILMALCRKSWCNPEILKYILIAKAYSAERCLCQHADPFQKYIPQIPFAQGESKSVKKGTDEYGYPLGHWFPKYLLHHLSKGQGGDDQKPKIFDKIPDDWLNKFYDLYNSTVAPKPEDQFELYLQELLQRNQLEKQLRKGVGTQDDDDIEDYNIDWEGRFEQPAEEQEINNNEYKDKEKDKDYKHETRKSSSANTKRKYSTKEERRSRVHNPVDIFYFDPLSEAQRQAYKLILPHNLGPSQYRPPSVAYDKSALESQRPTTYGPMASHLQRRQSRFQVPVKRQPVRPLFKSKSRPALSARKSIFHSFGYT